MVAVDGALLLSSVVVRVMIEVLVMVFPFIGRIVVVGALRSTYPEIAVLFPMFPTWSTIRQLMVNDVVLPLLLVGGIKDGFVLAVMLMVEPSLHTHCA